MNDTIRLLETRVREAADRIRGLAEERAALAEGDDARDGWRAERDRVIDELRETLAEFESA